MATKVTSRPSRGAKLAGSSGQRLPRAPRSIQKGRTLKTLLGEQAAACLAHNIRLVHPNFPDRAFRQAATRGIAPLSILQRGAHLARVLRAYLPERYESALQVLIDSLTPPLAQTENNGLAVFFYLPHVAFVGAYGLDAAGNGGQDPFEASMRAQYEFTRRFSAEFSMRAFLNHAPERTLSRLMTWTRDSDPHVRRLCSEGSRPRLPWAVRIPSFIEDPRPVLPILEALKDDSSLYVRRSVANHVGDIAKDHLALALELCERWLQGASAERKWLIRHALRYPARKGHKRAQSLHHAAR